MKRGLLINIASEVTQKKRWADFATDAGTKLDINLATLIPTEKFLDPHLPVYVLDDVVNLIETMDPPEDESEDVVHPNAGYWMEYQSKASGVDYINACLTTLYAVPGNLREKVAPKATCLVIQNFFIGVSHGGAPINAIVYTGAASLLIDDRPSMHAVQVITTGVNISCETKEQVEGSILSNLKTFYMLRRLLLARGITIEDNRLGRKQRKIQKNQTGIDPFLIKYKDVRIDVPGFGDGTRRTIRSVRRRNDRFTQSAVT